MKFTSRGEKLKCKCGNDTFKGIYTIEDKHYQRQGVVELYSDGVENKKIIKKDLRGEIDYEIYKCAKCAKHYEYDYKENGVWLLRGVKKV